MQLKMDGKFHLRLNTGKSGEFEMDDPWSPWPSMEEHEEEEDNMMAIDK